MTAKKIAVLMGSPSDRDKMAPAAETLARYGIEADVRIMSAHTTLPVIGVPLSYGALNGVDALYATVQMPKGIPVATVAIDGAMNAALLAVQMLAIDDPLLAKQLEEHRAEMAPPTS